MGIVPWKTCIMAKDDQKLLSKPKDLIEVWNNRNTSGLQRVSFWLPAPQEDYKPIGIIIQVGYTKPTVENIRLVHKDLLAVSDIGKMIWSSKGMNTNPHVSLWCVTPEVNSIQTGLFVMNRGFEPPSFGYTLLTSKIKITTDTSIPPEIKLPPKGKKLLFIGLDGCRGDCLLQSNSPNLKNFLKEGAYSFRGQTNDITLSGPGWSSLFTGVWRDKHGVRENSFIANNFETYPSFFHRLRKEYPTLKSSSSCHWTPINDIILNNPTNKTYTLVKWNPITFINEKPSNYEFNCKSDDEVEEKCIEMLKKEDISLHFLHFDDIDHTGHQHGFHPSKKEYIEAIEKTDKRIERILKTIENSKDEWSIIVSTDHGGEIGGHGRDLPECRTIFYLCKNKNVKLGEIKDPVNSVDIPFTIFHHFQLKVESEWKLDGKLKGF